MRVIGAIISPAVYISRAFCPSIWPSSIVLISRVIWKIWFSSERHVMTVSFELDWWDIFTCIPLFVVLTLACALGEVTEVDLLFIMQCFVVLSSHLPSQNIKLKSPKAIVHPNAHSCYSKPVRLCFFYEAQMRTTGDPQSYQLRPSWVWKTDGNISCYALIIISILKLINWKETIVALFIIQSCCGKINLYYIGI